jgi:hypothetical protein
MPTADLAAAGRFVASHARLVDRRRFAHRFEGAPRRLVRDAVAAYRNADGGFGALEPDIRTLASQPLPTLYAFDFLHEAGVADPGLTAGALDWLATIANDDGGVSFVLPSVRDADHSPWLEPQPGDLSSLHATSALAAAAHRLRLSHPWLDRATAFAWDRLPALDVGSAYEVRYVVDFLDAVRDRNRAAAALEELRPHVPPTGLPVRGGAEGETLSPLIVAPWPEHAGRGLFSDEAIEQALDDLAAGQHGDGGWTFDWPPLNDAVLWEWRGAVTVNACRTLRAYGRL